MSEHPFALQECQSEKVTLLRSAGKNTESLSVTFKTNDDFEHIIGWLELEVKRRLLLMDAKLDLVGDDVQRCMKILDDNEKSSWTVEPLSPKRADRKRRGSVLASERKLDLELMKHTRRGSARRGSDKSKMTATPAFEEIGDNKVRKDWQQENSGLSAPESIEDVPIPENQPAPLLAANHVIDAKSHSVRTTQISNAFTQPSSLLSNSNTSAWENDSDRMYPLPEETTDTSSYSRKGSYTSRGALRKRQGKRFSTLRFEGLTSMHLGVASRFGQWKERIWNFLDDIESSRAAAYNATAMQVFLLLAFFASLFQSGISDDDPMGSFMKDLMAPLEIVVDLVCITEFTIRFVVCPNKCHFCASMYAWIDFFAAYPPLIVRLAVGGTVPQEDSPAKLILVCAVPILRLFKILRHFEQLRLLLNAFELAFEALPVLVYMLLMITLMASAGVYASEPRDNVETLPDAIWVSIVTVATVGYGDLYPVTVGGKLCIVALIVVSVLYMAAPLGIIGSAFEEVWHDRDRILLMQKTRDRLMKWGYRPQDISLLFEMADSDNTGEVDIDEFRDLIRNMKIGLSDDRIATLFNSFDEDGSGSISSKEFIRHIFPNQYLEIFRDEPDTFESSSDSVAPDDRPSQYPRSTVQSRRTRVTFASQATIRESKLEISETLHETESQQAMDESESQ